MGFKDLFIKSDENPDDKPVEKIQVPVKETTKMQFPTSEREKSVEREIPKSTPKQTSSFNFGFGDSQDVAPKQTFIPTSNVDVTQEQIDKALVNYENGFDSLNQAGYDFYEFFKMVAAGGIDNTPIYSMAFALGKTIDPNITKEALISKSDYYIDEINKVYNNFATQGNNKKEEILNQKTQENQALLNEVESISEQIESLKIQLADRENKLSAIDSKYSSTINDVDTKLTANSRAKDIIIGKIQSVKNGIITNVK